MRFNTQTWKQGMWVYLTLLPAWISTSMLRLLDEGICPPRETFAEALCKAAEPLPRPHFPQWVREWWTWRPRSAGGDLGKLLVGFLLAMCGALALAAVIVKTMLWLAGLLVASGVIALVSFESRHSSQSNT